MNAVNISGYQEKKNSLLFVQRVNPLIGINLAKMEQEIKVQSKKCLKCGSKKFKQEVAEIYDKYLDSEGKIIRFEDELTHDLEFGKIRCIKCGLEAKELSNC